MENIKLSVLSSLFWRFMERCGAQGIQFIIQIVLARLLFPEDYGILAVITIFINFSNTIIQGGLNAALIQKRDVDEIDYSSVFYISMTISGLLYLIIFLISPIIGNIYKNTQLVVLLRVLSIILFVGAFNSIQVSIISKMMHFKKLFFSTLGSIIASGVIGILLAYMGFGVWALVYQQIIYQLLNVIILWFTLRWRPVLSFSLNRVKILFSFGWKILLSSLIYNFYNDIRILTIGKFFNAEMLGFYNRGSQFPEIIVNNINGSIQSVMLPAFATQQDNIVKLKNMMRRTILTSSYIVFPLMVGLLVIAEPLVKILLTDKWLPSIPFIRIFCVTFALVPIHTSNQQAINALGRSDLSLKLNIIKRFVDLVILGITVSFGVYAIALGGIASGIIGSFINAHPNKKILNYGYLEQWKDIMPSLLLSLIMGIIVYSIQVINMSTGVTLLFQVIIGIIVYYSLSRIFKLECYKYLLETLKEYFIQRKIKR